MLDAAANGKGGPCQLSVVGEAALMRTASAVMEGAYNRTCGIGRMCRQPSS